MLTFVLLNFNTLSLFFLDEIIMINGSPIALLMHVAPISDARDDSFGFWFDLVVVLEISLALLLRLATSTLIVAAVIVFFFMRNSACPFYRFHCRLGSLSLGRLSIKLINSVN